MKKIFYSLLFFLFVSLSATADNYFTTGVNDTVRIHPFYLGESKFFGVKAHFDGRLDYWHLTFGYPAGLSYNNATVDSASMCIPFVNQLGHDSICNAELSILQSGNVIMSTITEFGYYDINGDSLYESYGTVKWEPGYYDPMFNLKINISNSFRSGYLTIRALMSSTHDWRDNTIGAGVESFRSIFFYVGYMRGDVDGNERLTIADISELVNYMLNPDTSDFDEFQIAAADVNGDGEISIVDVADLTNIVLGNGASSQFINDLMEQLSGGSEM